MISLVIHKCRFILLLIVSISLRKLSSLAIIFLILLYVCKTVEWSLPAKFLILKGVISHFTRNTWLPDVDNICVRLVALISLQWHYKISLPVWISSIGIRVNLGPSMCTNSFSASTVIVSNWRTLAPSWSSFKAPPRTFESNWPAKY